MIEKLKKNCYDNFLLKKNLKCCILNNVDLWIYVYPGFGGSFMFEVEDKVCYGVVGVCQIEQIATPPIKDVTGDYYFLQPVYDAKGIIYCPVKNTKVAMRNVITKAECKKLIERAKNCKKDPLLNEKVTPMQYDEMVKSQDTLQLMHLIRALYNIKNERAKDLRKMKSADSRMLLTARKLLYGEIAVVTDSDFDDVSEILDAYLSIE